MTQIIVARVLRTAYYSSNRPRGAFTIVPRQKAYRMLARKSSWSSLSQILLFLLICIFVVAPQVARSRANSSATMQSAAVAGINQSSLAVDASATKISDLAWLEGRWRGEWGPRVAEQVWLAPKAGAMEGLFRVIESDKTLVIEFFTLVQKSDGITFYIRHFTPSLAPWEKTDATLLNLARSDGKKFDFENAVNGMPKSAALTRVDADTYISRSEIVPETGEPQVIEITYKRQPCAGPVVSGGNGGRQKKP
jgi:hypothetical protein